MKGKMQTVEEIVYKLRQVEVLLSKDQTWPGIRVSVIRSVVMTSFVPFGNC